MIQQRTNLLKFEGEGSERPPFEALKTPAYRPEGFDCAAGSSAFPSAAGGTTVGELGADSDRVEFSGAALTSDERKAVDSTLGEQ